MIFETSMAELSELVAEQLAGGGRVRLTVSGNSMYPMLRDRRDSVELSAPFSLKSGSIPLYKRPDGRFVLHRIIKRNKDGSFVICGDNQIKKERLSDKTAIIAEVSAFWRGEKRVELNTPWYVIYKTVWVRLFGMRPLMSRVLKLIMRIKGRILR